MSQMPPGGEPIGSAKVVFTGDTAPLEQAAAKAVDTTKAAAAEAQAAINQSAAGAGAGGIGGAAAQEVKSIGDSAKEAVGPLREMQRTARSVVGAFLGWAGIASLVGSAVAAVGIGAKKLWEYLSTVGIAAETTARKIDDPLLKTIEKLQKVKDVKININIPGLAGDAERLKEILPLIDELRASGLRDDGTVESVGLFRTRGGAQKEAEQLKKLVEEERGIRERQANAKKEVDAALAREQEQTAREMGDAAVKLFAEESKKKNDLDTALFNEIEQRKRAAEDAALEGIDLINRQEKRAFEELEALKARDTEGRFAAYIQEAYIATRAEYDFKRKKHEEEEQKKRDDRNKELDDISRQIDKEVKIRIQAERRVLDSIQQQADRLFNVDKLSVQLNELAKIMERVASNTRNING